MEAKFDQIESELNDVQQYLRRYDLRKVNVISVKKQLKSINLEIAGNKCELVSVKLIVENTKQVVIYASFRPPSSAFEVMENLKDALLQVLACKNFTLLLSGDFDLPDIDWEKNALKENLSHHRESRSYLVTISELGLRQFVDFPTRGDNIPDLILANKEFSVSNVLSCPGVSDHDMIRKCRQSH